MVVTDIEKSYLYFEQYGLRFYFSSPVYLEKYSKLVDSYVKEQMLRNKIKYGIDMLPYQYFMIALYKKIEKRGFRVYYNYDFRKDAEGNQINRISETSQIKFYIGNNV